MRRLARDRRGSVSLLAAGGLVAAVGGLSFAADLGSAYLTGRRLQGIADAAALSAAGDLSQPLTQAQATVTANGWQTRATTNVATGRWQPDAPLAARFASGAADADSARVTLSTEAPLYFGRLFGRSSLRLTRQATALRSDMASFSLGSRLASVDAGIANALLGGLAGGSSISLTAADYQALAGADVDLLGFAAVVRANTSTSYEQAFAAAQPMPTILARVAATLDAGGSAAAAAAVRKLAPATAAMASVPLSALIALGPIGKQDHAAAGQPIRVNAWDMVHGLMETSGGPRQIKLALAGTIPGLTSVTAYLAIGSRAANSPWTTVTAKSEPVVRTSQTRLYLDASIATSGTLASLYLIPQVRLPLYVELAAAEAKLSAVGCRGGGRTATLLVNPALGHASLAAVATDAATFANQSVSLTESAVPIVSVLGPLISVSGQSRTDLSGTGFQSVAFSAADIAARTTKTVNAGATVAGIAASLVGKTNLTVQVGPLKLPSPAIGSLVGGVLTTAAPALDGVLGSLTDLLGIHLGQADVRVNGLRCGIPVLVA